jgi:hypothetical protein
VRLRAARSIPPVIRTIVMLRILGTASAHVNVSVFNQPLTPPTGLGLLGVAPHGGTFPVGQRVARSLPERWPAVRPRGTQALPVPVQGHRLALEGGSLSAAPF